MQLLHLRVFSRFTSASSGSPDTPVSTRTSEVYLYTLAGIAEVLDVAREQEDSRTVFRTVNVEHLATP